MTSARMIAAALLLAGGAACATAPAVNPPPNSDAARTAAIIESSQRWTASLNPTQGNSGVAVTTTRQKAFGTVELTVSPNRPSVSHVRLTVSVPMEPGLNSLGWGIHEGSCGSGTPLIMSAGTFPVIILSPNGRGTVDDDIPLTLPQTGSYHVNVFRGSGNQLTDVITCGEIRRQR